MNTNQTIKVFVRTKPSTANVPPDALSLNPEKNLLHVDEGNSLISFSRERKGQAEFQFSKVFGQSVSQQNVYSACSTVVAQDVMEGVNCCIMAYGQTGSGKTYTMYGKGWEENNTGNSEHNNRPSTPRPGTPSLDNPQIGIADSEPVEALGGGQDGVEMAAGETELASALPELKQASKLPMMPSSGSLLATGDDESMLGVIPRSISDLFRLLDEKSSGNKSFDFSVSECHRIFLLF